MRGKNDGVILAKPADQVADLDDLLGIEPDRRFVEDDDFRVADKCLRDADPLTISLGKVANDPLVNLFDPHGIADLFEVLFAVEFTAF